jgi:mannose-6-phosphate isomerase-like protein (cupin superfamily)
MIFSEFKKIDKPWGHERLLALTDYYCLKEIFLKSGCRTSLQYHEKKMESIYILQGTGTIEVSPLKGTLEKHTIGPGSGWTIVPNEIHRMSATEDLLYHEASTIELSDVIRIEDDYKRI